MKKGSKGSKVFKVPDKLLDKWVKEVCSKCNIEEEFWKINKTRDIIQQKAQVFCAYEFAKKYPQETGIFLKHKDIAVFWFMSAYTHIVVKNGQVFFEKTTEELEVFLEENNIDGYWEIQLDGEGICWWS